MRVICYDTCEKHDNITVPKFPNGTKNFHIKVLEFEKNKLEKIINKDYDSLRKEDNCFTYPQKIANDVIRDREKKYVETDVSKLHAFINTKQESYKKNKIFRDFMKEPEGKHYEEIGL